MSYAPLELELRAMNIDQLNMIKTYWGLKIKSKEKKDAIVLSIIDAYKSKQLDLATAPPKSLLKSYQDQLELSKTQSASLQTQKAGLALQIKQDYCAYAARKELGFFCGMPKDIFQYMLSFLNPVDLCSFAATNKIIMALCGNPTITPWQRKRCNALQNSRIMFIPQELGKLLQLPDTLRVNRYFIATRLLAQHALFFCVLKKRIITATRTQTSTIPFKAQTEPNIFTDFTLATLDLDQLINLLLDCNIAIDVNKLRRIYGQNHPSMGYMRRSLNQVYESISEVVINYKSQQILWDLNMDQTFGCIALELRYYQAVAKLCAAK